MKGQWYEEELVMVDTDADIVVVVRGRSSV